ncbi:MAG: hypothetical protein ACRDHL_02060 [Candidatus Promineifilaceae bacterium]
MPAEAAVIRLFIAGARKAATTSLLRYLGQHPGICAQWTTEFGVFSIDSLYAHGVDAAIRSAIPGADRVPQRILVAKDVRLMYDPAAIDRLARYNPGAHIAVVMRHPVERAYSHYWYARRTGQEPLATFEAALEAPPGRFGADRAWAQACSYLESSRYLGPLQALREFFPPDQLQLFLFEEFTSDPAEVCCRLWALFPELGGRFEPDVRQRHNSAARARWPELARITHSRRALPRLKRELRRLLPGSRVDALRDGLIRLNERNFSPPPMRPETRQALLAHFEGHNRELGRLLGLDLSAWNR